MRSSLVVKDKFLTPFGQWLAARVPHTVYDRLWPSVFPRGWAIRVFGFQPFYRFAIFDLTIIPEIGHRHLTVFGWRVFTQERHP